jgi:Tol biopolymer transport system component
VLISLDGGSLQLFDLKTGSHSIIESDLSNSAYGSASISPDGEWVAFELRRNQQVHVAYLNGENQQQISNIEGSKAYISWSPDQKQVIFTAYYDETRFLIKLDLDNEQQHVLAESKTHAISHPSWHPSGERIFYTLSSLDATIWEINLMTNETMKVTTNDIDSAFSIWSPDGNSIAYHSKSDDGWYITIGHLEAGTFTVIRHTEEQEVPLCWLPKLSLPSGKEALIAFGG